ncbi:tripartite tricarboxylate transporter substrate binding protein [Ancylobacter mangrovi]|uniref:tripartite tricarboxylate transporter substrate binding protein n=1 Tax=Ancylobacter mangrovi TaxID=2972472 RepID=UPI0021615B2A|nr:tripartite tricarboxylate transporter substrate binding protein [Ancylobacter mangrovi]MCS0502574.1 tripartite tricarboxylate transporter substrate binding protein [Ancylobacter mangrovi]
MDRRLFIAGAAATLAGTQAARGQPGPPALDPLTLFVPSTRGGGWDRTARAMQESLIESGAVADVGLLYETAGAAAGIADFLTRYHGRPDTLLVGGLGMIGAVLLGRVPADLSRLTPIARLTNEYMVLAVAHDSETDSLRDILAELAHHPGSVSFAGGNRGNVDHLFVGLIGRAAGVRASAIPYRAFVGGMGAVDYVTSGGADCVVDSLSALQDDIAIGRLRGLAISSPQRLPGIAIPTCFEQGAGIEISNWRGVFAPPGVDAADAARLQAMVGRMLASLAWRAALFQYSWSSDVLIGPPFRIFLNAELARVRSLLSGFGLR